MPTRVGLTLAVTFVDLISLLDISSAAPGVAGGQSITPGVFDDKLQDGLALAGALAVAGTATPPLVPAPITGPGSAIDTTNDVLAAPTSALPVAALPMAALDAVAPASTIDGASDPSTAPAATVPPTTVTDTTVTDTTVTNTTVTDTTVTNTTVTNTTVTNTTAIATAGQIAVGTAAVLAAPVSPDQTANPGSSATTAVPLDAVRADTSLAHRLLGGLRLGRDSSRTGRDPLHDIDQPSVDDTTQATEVTAVGVVTTEATTDESTATDPASSQDVTTNEVSGRDVTTTGSRSSAPELHTSTTGAGTSSASSADGATGTGLFHTDKVRYLRDLAPAREIQRLAVDLDDARVAVRFGGGATTVDVVSDPSSRLDAGWVSSVEKSLRQMDSPTAPPSSGSRDGSDTRNGGQDRSMQDERRRRALEDATQRRWHDAATTSGED